MAEAEVLVNTPPLSGAYSADAAVYDELRSAAGTLRPHWQGLVHYLDSIGPEELSRRHEEVLRLLQENGVTYNVYDDPRDLQRPWIMDPIPLLITGEEWAVIEAGLVQRSRLLNRLLADLYGPRTVIRQGVLPAALIYGHPGFLHPCHESLPADRRWLIFHGVDLARTADGAFCVLGDSIQSPSGAGYTLENRIIMARAFPKLYRDAPLRRLASFLETERATLNRLARHNQEHPNLVLLTRGPTNPAYFEHAYLANYLSLSLVEGEDLTVRDGRVWLKTLGGLKAVDVILRRVDDDYCDPLELRGDSLRGVPGLLQAVRQDGVAIANPLGGGIIENPALLPFLPNLCRFLLGEDLRLPGVPTWWCGQAPERDFVLAHLDELVVQSVLPGQQPVLGAELEPDARTQLAERIAASPHLFIGQQPLALATAPALVNGRLAPRWLVLRGFTVADQDGYRVMPGGLARLSTRLGNLNAPVQKGGVSKDLWVLAPAPQKHVTLLRQAHGPIVVTRDGSDLPSRVAENLYWLGRYGERLDSTVRLLRETLARLLEQEHEADEDDCLNDLLTALDLAVPPGAAAPRTRFMGVRRELLRLLTDTAQINSVPTIFSGMMRTGRAVRDHLGDDGWRLLNRLQGRIQRIPVPLTAREGRELLEDQLTLLAAFFGLTNETIPHHYGWRFLDIGRHLERVLNTLDLFKLAFITARSPGVPLWEVVLNTTDNLTAYRRRYRSALHPTAIMDLLLFDEGNPRSVGYQLKRLQTQISRLPQADSTPYRSAEERLMLEAVTRLQLADIEALAQLAQSPAAQETLSRLLADLYRSLEALSDALTHRHFSHAQAPRQLVRMR